MALDPRAPLSADTALAAERVMLERLRVLGPTGRLARVAELRQATVGTAELRLRKEHPNWSAQRIRVELAKTWLGADLHLRVFGSEQP